MSLQRCLSGEPRRCFPFGIAWFRKDVCRGNCGDRGRRGCEEDGMASIGRHRQPPWTTAVELIPPPHMTRTGMAWERRATTSSSNDWRVESSIPVSQSRKGTIFFATYGGMAKNPFVKVECNISRLESYISVWLTREEIISFARMAKWQKIPFRKWSIASESHLHGWRLDSNFPFRNRGEKLFFLAESRGIFFSREYDLHIPVMARTTAKEFSSDVYLLLSWI